MSAPARGAMPLRVMPRGVPFGQGHDPRRSMGALTKAERQWKQALDDEHIPMASGLLHTVRGKAYAALEAGNLADGAKLAELYFKVCGLIRKPTSPEEDGAKLGAAMAAFLEDLRARRAQEPDGR